MKLMNEVRPTPKFSTLKSKPNAVVEGRRDVFVRDFSCICRVEVLGLFRVVQDESRKPLEEKGVGKLLFGGRRGIQDGFVKALEPLGILLAKPKAVLAGWPKEG